MPVPFDYLAANLDPAMRASRADKSQALASYARQADDETLFKLARRIQARAVRRVGELLKLHRTGPKGGRPANGGDRPTVSQRAVAAAAGISKKREVTAARGSIQKQWRRVVKESEERKRRDLANWRREEDRRDDRKADLRRQEDQRQQQMLEEQRRQQMLEEQRQQMLRDSYRR